MRRLLLVLVPAAALLVACSGDNDVEVSGGDDRPAVTTVAGSDETAAPDTTVGGSDETAAPEPTTGGSSEAPDGWRAITIPDEGLTLAVPDDFEAPDFATEDLAGFLDRFEEQFPGAQLPPGAAAQVGDLLKLFAIDPETGENVNVIVTPGELPVDLLADQAGQTLSGQFGSDVSVEKVTIDGAEAVQAVVNTSAGGRDTKLTQLYVAANGKTFIITVTDTVGGDLADGVRDSIQLG